jgi:hypothetical protein
MSAPPEDQIRDLPRGLDRDQFSARRRDQPFVSIGRGLSRRSDDRTPMWAPSITKVSR